MKKILVTGSKGQLGSEIRDIADNYKPFELIYTDIDELDITNKEAVTRFFRDRGPISYVINCAAYTAVDKAEEDHQTARKINVDAVKILADTCAENNATIIHISTDYVFDGKNFKPYIESDQTKPESAYGKTKLDGELALKSSRAKGINIRTSWLYSSYGNNFVKTMMRLTAERDELGVIFDQIGTPTYARDLAIAVMDIISYSLSYPESLHIGTYHYSNEGVCSWYDFAKEIATYAGHDCAIKPIEGKDYPLPAPRPYYSVLNKTSIKKTFGIVIPHWKASLFQCMDKIKKGKN